MTRAPPRDSPSAIAIAIVSDIAPRCVKSALGCECRVRSCKASRSITRRDAPPPMSAQSRYVAAALHFAALSLGASPAFAAWTSVDYGNDGADPTMTLYTPTTPDASPGVIVALHACEGTAASAQGWFTNLANQYGFLIIAPRRGPGELLERQSSARRRTRSHRADGGLRARQPQRRPRRIFVAGSSSGGCMTEALLAAYPEVFAAGAALAGVPAGQWTGGNTCNGSCNTEAPTKTAEQWGDLSPQRGSRRVRRSLATLPALSRHDGRHPLSVDD